MAALSIEQNKAESELKQAALEEQQHSVIQPLACAPEHCVYICNLTYPLGSHRHPTRHQHRRRRRHHTPAPPPPPPPPFAPARSQPSCPCTFFLSPISLSHSHRRVIPSPFLFIYLFFYILHSFLHKDIVKQIRPRAFSH